MLDGRLMMKLQASTVRKGLMINGLDLCIKLSLLILLVFTASCKTGAIMATKGREVAS